MSKRLFSKLLVFAYAATIQAQSLQLSSGTPNVRPGQTINTTVNLAGTSTTTAVQWSLVAPTGWAAQNPTLTLASSLQKQIACSVTSCILYGLNQTALPPTSLGTVAVSVPASATAGQYVLSLSNALGTDASGTAIALSSAPLTITVLSKFDVTGDGQITLADINAVLSAVLENMAHSTPPGLADLDGDGKATVADFGLELGQWIAAGSKP